MLSYKPCIERVQFASADWRCNTQIAFRIIVTLKMKWENINSPSYIPYIFFFLKPTLHLWVLVFSFLSLVILCDTNGLNAGCSYSCKPWMDRVTRNSSLSDIWTILIVLLLNSAEDYISNEYTFFFLLILNGNEFNAIRGWQ